MVQCGKHYQFFSFRLSCLSPSLCKYLPNNRNHQTLRNHHSGMDPVRGMCGLMVMDGILVDVPGDDAVHGAHLRCRRLLSLQPSLRRCAPIGSDGSAVGHGLFSIGDSGRALCQRRDSEGRVSGKEGRDSLRSVALTATVKRSWASDSFSDAKRQAQQLSKDDSV